MSANRPENQHLRISYLFSQFPVPTQTFAQSDIDVLLDMGHQVTVHTIKPGIAAPGRGDGETAQEGLRILRPTLAKAMSWPRLIWLRRVQLCHLIRLIMPRMKDNFVVAIASLLSLPRVIEIAEEVISNRSQVVHVFWSRQAALVLPVLRELGVPSVRSSFVGAYDLVADDFLIDIALSNSDVAFSHAESNRAYLERTAPDGLPIHIVHRGIPLPSIRDDAERDLSLWVTASALVKEKNVACVIRAFAAARMQNPDLRLVVCGDGPERVPLERLSSNLGCANAVSFAGHIDRGELFAILQRAGVFMMMSKKASERLPNVVKEALWGGCFVITSNSVGIEELIPDPSFGLVVDPDDEVAVRSAVESALRETATVAEERRRRTRTMIAARFSNAVSMARYVSAWQQAMPT